MEEAKGFKIKTMRIKIRRLGVEHETIELMSVEEIFRKFGEETIGS
jgi:hypothetical protein